MFRLLFFVTNIIVNAMIIVINVASNVTCSIQLCSTCVTYNFKLNHGCRHFDIVLFNQVKMYYISTRFVLHVTNNSMFDIGHMVDIEVGLILQCLMNIHPNFICSLPIGRDWHCKASSLMESGNLQSKYLLPPFDNPMAMWFALMMLPLLDIVKWSILLTPIH
jgi:hypothetical protein